MPLTPHICPRFPNSPHYALLHTESSISFLTRELEGARSRASLSPISTEEVACKTGPARATQPGQGGWAEARGE
eukprot:scaffold1795_cov140-Isochrysis_galbana.AAC.1